MANRNRHAKDLITNKNKEGSSRYLVRCHCIQRQTVEFSIVCQKWLGFGKVRVLANDDSKPTPAN